MKRHAEALLHAEREHEIAKRHTEAHRERAARGHGGSEGEIAQLKDRIHELESMVEALVQQIEEMKDRPRGVRN